MGKKTHMPVAGKERRDQGPPAPQVRRGVGGRHAVHDGGARALAAHGRRLHHIHQEGKDFSGLTDPCSNYRMEKHIAMFDYLSSVRTDHLILTVLVI